MTNRELQFIMSLRDQFSAQWNRAIGNAQASLARMRAQLDAVRGWVAGALSVAAVRNFVNAFAEQERASARLEQALRNAGVTSREVLADMEAFSSEMQRLTVYGDEVVTNVQAMITAMTGLTGTAVQPLTVAALDLASGLQIDAESAAQLIAKTLEGQDALGRYGISVKGAKDEMEKMSIIIDQVRTKFGGFAEREAQTAAGSMKQFQNALGDLQEEFGQIIVNALAPFIPLLQKILEMITAAPVPIQAMVLAVGGLTAAFFALNIPLGGIPIAIGAVLVGLTGLAAWIAENSEKVREFAATLTTGLLPGLNEFGVALTLIATILGSFDGAQSNTAQSMNQMTEELRKQWAELAKNKPLKDTKEKFEAVAGSVTFLENKYNDLLKRMKGAGAPGSPTVIALQKQADEAWLALRRAEFQFDRFHGKMMEQAVQDMSINMNFGPLPQLQPLDPAVAAAAQQGLEAARDALMISRKELAAMSTIAPGLTEQYNRMSEQQALIAEYGQAWVDNLVAAEAQFENMQIVVFALTDTLRSAFSQAWHDIFGEANSLFEQFISRIAQGLVERLLRKLEENIIDKAATSFLKNIPIIGWFFHQGGTVPELPKAHTGAYVDMMGALKGFKFPGTGDIPIMVEGGETIRTRQQEAALQNMLQSLERPTPPLSAGLRASDHRTGPASPVVNIQRVEVNFNAPVNSKQMVVDGLKQALREAGATDVNKVVINTDRGLEF